MTTEETSSTESILEREFHIRDIISGGWNRTKDYIKPMIVGAGIIAGLYATISGISYVNSGNINTKGIKSSVLEEVVLDENGKKTKEKIKVSYVSIPHEQAETRYVDFKLDEDKNGTSLAYDQTQREVKLNKEHEKI